LQYSLSIFMCPFKVQSPKKFYIGIIILAGQAMLRIMAGKSSIIMQLFEKNAINRLKFADFISFQFHGNRALQKFLGDYEKLFFEIAAYYNTLQSGKKVRR
jgi:hypothetical protein